MQFDAVLLAHMTAALNIYDAVRAAVRADNLADWAQANPEAADIFKMTHRLEMEENRP